MINLLLGAPGGGKSYEAVAFHVIPALSEGRRVITNLPLQLEAFPPEWRALLDIRRRTMKPRPVVDDVKAAFMFKRFGTAPTEQSFNANPFANVEDYGREEYDEETDLTRWTDPWRHPVTGEGPLYVIDECHKALPARGTPIPVEEWFAEHRHGRADVLLMTQSHGKMNRAIKELVQLCYRVRKAVHLGFEDRYIRKVLDGVGGTEMNETTRHYDPAFFKYYRSHTQSTTAGREAAAKDIVPIWKHWTFKGAALMFLIAIIIFATSDVNILKSNKKTAEKPKSKPVPVAQNAPSKPPAPKAEPSPSSEPPVVESKPDKAHPLVGLGLHISGYLKSASHSMYLFAVSQNGQAVYTLNEDELVRSGYAVRSMNDCIAEVSFEAVKFYVTCDAPRVGVNPASNMPGKAS